MAQLMHCVTCSLCGSGASADSHVWGFLPQQYVEGRVFWRVLPPQRFAPLGRAVLEEADTGRQ